MREITHRAVRDVYGGWFAEAGFKGCHPYRAARFTRLGARFTAWRMASRLRKRAQ